MSRYTRLLLVLIAAAGLLFPVAATAQYPSRPVGFNCDPNIAGSCNDPVNSMEMFRIPQHSGTTNAYIVANTVGYNNNAAFRSTAYLTEGTSSLNVFYKWDPNYAPDPNNWDAQVPWVRLTTFDGVKYPNPGLHTAGKVRFKMYNISSLWNGNIALCLGVRETGVNVPQMDNGGSSGTIEFVGVSSTINGIVAGPNYIVNSVAAGDDIQVYPPDTYLDPNVVPSGTAVILPGPNGVINTTPGGDDQYRRGYTIGKFGERRPVPAMPFLIPDSFPYEFEVNLVNGNVWVRNSTYYPTAQTFPGAIAGFTGDGLLPSGRGVLEGIYVVKDPDEYWWDPGNQLIDVYIDEMRFEAPAPDPTVAPEVQPPLIQGATEVTVRKLMYWCRAVRWLRNGIPVETWNVPDPNSANPDDHPSFRTFTVVPPLNTGEVVTAQQQNHHDGTWSAESLPVTVLAGPPPYTFSYLIDEKGGGSCSATDWEYVAVTSTGGGWRPVGTSIMVDDAKWQAIDVPLTNPALVKASIFGDGILDPNKYAFPYYSIDTFWFTSADPNYLGPYEVFLDRMETLDANMAPTSLVWDVEDNINRLYRIRGQSPVQSVTAGTSTTAAYDGSYSHRLSWSFGDPNNLNSIGILQRTTSSCNTGTLLIDDRAAYIRLRMLARGRRTDPNTPLPSVVGPIIVGTQNAVRVNCLGYASMVYLFVDGIQVAQGAPAPGTTYVDFTGLSLTPGTSISAKQTVGAATSDFAYPKAALTYTPRPSVSAPLIPGATTVRVTGLLTARFAAASAATVYVRNDPNSAPVQTVPVALDPNNPVSFVNVTVAPLDNGQYVTATQMVNAVTSDESPAVIVAVPTPTIYAAPAANTTLIRVQDVLPGATAARIYLYPDPNVSSATIYTGTPDPQDPTVWWVNMSGSGMAPGYMVKASQVYLGVESPLSIGDPVTVTTSTNINPSWVPGPPFPDTIETYTSQSVPDDPHRFENVRWPSPLPANKGWWGSSDDPPGFFTGDPNFLTLYPGKNRNATPGGQWSVYHPAGNSPPYSSPTEAIDWTDGWQANFDFTYPEPDWTPEVTATYSAPIVWSVNIYDSGGVGTDNLYQWAELRKYTGATLNAIVAMGMPGSSFFPTGLGTTYYSARVFGGGPDYIDLNHTGAPTRSIGWHTFTAVIKLTYVDFYVDGVLARKNVARANWPYNNFYMGSGFAPGLEGWYDDFTVMTGRFTIPPRRPNPPVVVSPVVKDDTQVALTNIEPNVTRVEVFANANLIGTANPAGASSVNVPVSPPLVHLNSITAKAVATTDPNVPSDPSAALEVGQGNGDLRICIGIRETNEPGEPGQVGGTSGPIEWVGIGDPNSAVQPWGKSLPVTTGWQTFTFNPADPNTDPVRAMPGTGGNGVITATKGVLEHLAIMVNHTAANRSSGVYQLYVDEITNVGAGPGGTDVVLANGFEGYPVGAEVMFQEPTYSGTTSGNLSSPPSSSAIAALGYNSAQSVLLTWFFKDTTAGRWVRVTTSATGYSPQPIVDLTKPIRMRVLLQAAAPPPTGACCTPTGACSVTLQANCTGLNQWLGAGTTCTPNPCPGCKGDSNCDGIVTWRDIDFFVAAQNDNVSAWWAKFPPPGPSCPFRNNDVNNDGMVTWRDISPFVAVMNMTCPHP